MLNGVKQKFVSGVIIFALCFAPIADAGFFGKIEQNAKARYANEKAKHALLVKEHPVLGAMVVGASGAEVVRKVVHSPLFIPAVAVGTVSALAGGAYILHKYHCHITGVQNTVHMWTCNGVSGAHPWKQEAKDLVLHNSVNAKKLAKNMTLDGEPRPGKGCAAHHLVPSDDNSEFVTQARTILEHCGIAINSSINGVWLPQVKTGSDCQGVYHPGDIHGKRKENYYAWVLFKLRTAYTLGKSDAESCKRVKDTLGKIKSHLLVGETPWLK